MIINNKIDFDKIQNYIFDMDGTLVDSMHLWDNLLIDFLGRYGYETPHDLLREVACMSLLQSSALVSEMFDLGLSANDIYNEWLAMIYDGYAHDVKPKPGAKEFVKAARDAGKKIAVATANSRELTEVCLKNNGMLEYFDVFVFADDVGSGKSSPDIYLETLRQMGAEPENSVLFEDIYEALRTAKKIGLSVVIAEDAASVPDRPRLKSEADIYIKDFTELT